MDSQRNDKNLQRATLCFLVNNSECKGISSICLAMKKRGFGEGKWNGVGGKIEDNETVEQALRREANEEILVQITEYFKVAELTFNWPEEQGMNMFVYVYFAYTWQGEPSESEEMKPKWYKVSDIPYESMWSDDKYWLPLTLKGELIKAQFNFREGDRIIDKDIEIVKSI